MPSRPRLTPNANKRREPRFRTDHATTAGGILLPASAGFCHEEVSGPDRDSDFGTSRTSRCTGGALAGGVIGVNTPLGPAFVGVEGNGAKGFNDMDWEYGVEGRVGTRGGESGLIYASAGYEWVEDKCGFGGDKNWIYGIGVEVGPKDIGMDGAIRNSGVRFWLQMATYNVESLRPMGGVIFHF